MKIVVDKNAPIPAYKQVVGGIAKAVHRGDVGRGSRLPSVRNLALDLGLNVNTVARAYRDLERAGVIQTMPGMGTFVADDSQPNSTWNPSWDPLAPTTPSRPQPPGAELSYEPAGAGWRDWLAAARALAAAEGVGDEDFVSEAATAVQQTAKASFLAIGSSPAESSDILRALPPGLAGRTRVGTVEELADVSASGQWQGVLSTSPGQSEIRRSLGERQLEVVPIETEFTETTVRALSGLRHDAKLALVTVEQDNWDHEANDVMKITGRSRWLKMICLQGADKGLAERIEQVEAVLHVPRARDDLAALGLEGKTTVELVRQVTSRTKERLDRLASSRGGKERGH